MEDIIWSPTVQDFNNRFTKALDTIKRRHDPTVTTIAQGVLEWKKSHGEKNIGLEIQSWLDRFYMSRIGIRFLIGQRAWRDSFVLTCFHVLDMPQTWH
jgi:pyruvate dehydrogenase kinase 2/3/4